MKTVTLTIVLLLFAVVMRAQERFTVVAGVGIGSYKMEDLKGVHDQSFDYYPGVETISRFPSYLYYNGEVYLRLNSLLSLGLVYRLQSTGSKVAYSDYSGSWVVEQLIKSNNVGISADFLIWSVNRVSLSAQLRAYYGFTKYAIRQNVEVANVQQTYYSWKSESTGSSISLNPDVVVAYRVWNNVSLGLHAGYAIDFKGQVAIKSQYYRSEVDFDWSGLRLGISTSYKF